MSVTTVQMLSGNIFHSRGPASVAEVIVHAMGPSYRKWWNYGIARRPWVTTAQLF